MTICIVILKSLIILLMNILNKLFFKFQNSFRWVEQLVWRKALQMRVENCLLPLIRFPLLSFSLRRVYITTKNQYWYIQFSSVQSLSRVQLCDTMNRSTPGLPVHHQLPEFTQIHVHPVSDVIQPSHPLSSPSPPGSNPSQHQSLFQWVNSSHEVAKVRRGGKNTQKNYTKKIFTTQIIMMVWSLI